MTKPIRALGGGLGGLLLASLVWAGPAGDALSQLEAQVAALQAQVLRLEQSLADHEARLMALEAGTPPPVTYVLTTITAGTGGGFVSSAGATRRRPRTIRPHTTEAAYVAGTSITLTATPETGSTFAGWSPAPCAPSFVMPAAALTCTGTFTRTAPPVTGPGWIELADAAHSPPDFAFQWMAWDSKRGVIHTTDPGPAFYGNWRFDPATNVWANILPSQPSPPGLIASPGTRHNCGFVYDSKRDRVWISACGPAPDFAHWAYDPAANVWTNHGSNTLPGMDMAMAYDPGRDLLIAFGGWGAPGYGTWHKKPADGLGAPYTLIENLPAELVTDVQSDAGKETMNRSAWDPKRGELWYIGTAASDLWTYAPGTQVWTKHPTTGSKPPAYTVFGYNPVDDVILAWTGCNGWDCADVRSETRRLNRTTLVWTLAESAAAGQVVPPSGAYQSHVMLWDSVRQQMILRTASGVSNTGPTWAYRMTATPPPSGSLPLKQWVAVPLPVLTSASNAADQTPFYNGGSTKDIGVTFDTQTGHILYGTGDVSPSPGDSTGIIVGHYTYRTGTNEWARISDHCPATGEIPARPTDRGPYVYDSTRHGLWVWQNGYFPPLGQSGTVDGTPCAPGRATLMHGMYFFSLATKTWTRRTDFASLAGNLGNGVYDAGTDSVLVIQEYACPGIGTGSKITAYHMGATPYTSSFVGVCTTRVPTYPASGGWIPPQQANRNYPAWDAATRTMYFCARIQNSDGVRFESECYQYHRPSGTVMVLPPPPVASPPQWDYYTTLVWDSTAQRVLWPVVSNACAHLQAMLAYDPVTGTWETVPLAGASPVVGSTIVYDPVANAVVLVGSVFCSDYGLTPGQTHLYLYRHQAAAR